MSTISVALPVRNGAQYLAAALDSVLGQDHGDFTLAVSDNASTDATPDILAEYARRDSRVRVSRSDEPLPQAANVNRAVALCESEWVKLFCHDDLLHQHCLGAIVTAIARPGMERVVLIGNGEEHLYANGYRHQSRAAGRAIARFDGPPLVRATFEGRAPIPLPSLTTATVRRSSWAATSGFDARFVHFDVFFWMQLLLHGDLIYIPDVLTVNRIHGQQVFAEARRTLRTADDYRAFPPEFIEAHGAQLGLGWRARLATWLRPTLNTGTLIAMEVLAGRARNVWRIVSRTPARSWPLLPLAVARGVASERRKLHQLRPHVPLSHIYPT